MERIVVTEKRDIKYTLTYKSVKNINLRIKPDGSVLVSAPHYIDAERIDEFVKSKSDFINSALDKFEKSKLYKPALKQYVSGEIFYFLGNSLELKVIESNENKVYIDQKSLYLLTKNIDDLKYKEKIINKWYKEQTIKIYDEIAREVHKKFIKFGVDFPTIKFRKMKTRWGSCQYINKIITLNSVLIQTPKDCIEYVMSHEFCHFIHPNHSKAFYCLLQTILPNWREKKILLEKYKTIILV